MFTTRPELRGSFGMVSSTHWLASQAGMAVLEMGGNAFDAAVATGLVLEVVEPHLNGLGGEVPAIFWSATESRVRVLCGQGTAPAQASIAHFAQLGLTSIPGTGPLAACVPGAFGGWMTLLRDRGSVSLREVMQYAIYYAEVGHPLSERVAQTIAGVEALFRSEWPESAKVFLPDGLPQAGRTFVNPLLAQTYRRLLDQGEAAGAGREAQIDGAIRAFYQGFVAEVIEAASQTPAMDSSGERHQALLRGQDLAGWRASEEDPVRLDYQGWTVCKAGPWSQGPVLLQQLGLLQGFPLREMGFLSPDHVHTVVECAKLAFADREAWYGDPNFSEIPLAGLLSDNYQAHRRELIGPSASMLMRPGTPGDRPPRLPTWGSAPIAAGHWTGTGSQAVGETGTRDPNRGDTCHVDVADRFGNLIAATPSGGWLQSSPALPGLGFCLGTRAQMFTLEEGFASSLSGGKRPRTTLTPSLALQDGEPRLAFGTPGGDQQDQWSLEFFLAHAVFGLNLQAAIDAPMFHSVHFPSSFAPHESEPGRMLIEGRVPPELLDELRRRGHLVSVEEPWSLGRLCAVGLDSERGQLVAAANPRGMQGYAVGR